MEGRGGCQDKCMYVVPQRAAISLSKLRYVEPSPLNVSYVHNQEIFRGSVPWPWQQGTLHPSLLRALDHRSASRGCVCWAVW